MVLIAVVVLVVVVVVVIQLVAVVAIVAVVASVGKSPDLSAVMSNVRSQYYNCALGIVLSYAYFLFVSTTQ